MHDAKEDPAAFARLYDAYYPTIYNYILRRTADPEAAADVTADTFFKALDKLWQFRWQGLPFSAWLYRIATNEVNRHYRRKRPVASLEELASSGFEPSEGSTPEDELMAIEDELARHEAYRACVAAMKSLDSRYQDVLSLRFFEHKKLSEIAEILGKPEGTVKSLLHRGIALLRDAQPSAEERIMDSEHPVRAEGQPN